MKTANLTPTTGQKSFYSKAKLIEKETKTLLTSYDTTVAWYDKRSGQVIINGWYSATTAKHINSFLNSLGFDSLTKKEMQQKPILQK
jgi:hypothetical protein